MATTDFIGLLANQTIQSLSGSGIGFFGAGGFGSSVQVGSWNSSSFITNSAGTTQGPQINNVQYANSASGVLPGVGATGLLYIPNYQATFNYRLTNPTPVHTQNSYLTVYDGTANLANGPSGLVAMMAEIRHYSQLQNTLGSGSPAWVNVAGTGSVLSLSNSPCTSGIGGGGPDTQHDWFIAISESPSSVGGKSAYNNLYAYTEYF